MAGYCGHMDVGIRELKDRLSAYVARAARGETITVTERGVPKARLGPLPGRLNLEAGVAEGWVTAGSSDPPSRPPRARARRSIAAVLGEDRGA